MTQKLQKNPGLCLGASQGQVANLTLIQSDCPYASVCIEGKVMGSRLRAQSFKIAIMCAKLGML